MHTDLPSPELLRKLLRYDSCTGKLHWRVRPLDMFPNEASGRIWNTRFAEKEAFSELTYKGYLRGRFLYKKYLAHRVVWAISHGAWPNGQIDHVNGNRSDNRIENLRDVTPSENARNSAIGVNNTSGTIGVCWDKRIKKWSARTYIDGGCQNLGSFVDKNDAIRARKEAEKKIGFHENHGSRLARDWSKR